MSDGRGGEVRSGVVGAEQLLPVLWTEHEPKRQLHSVFAGKDVFEVPRDDQMNDGIGVHAQDVIKMEWGKRGGCYKNTVGEGAGLYSHAMEPASGYWATFVLPWEQRNFSDVSVSSW